MPKIRRTLIYASSMAMALLLLMVKQTHPPVPPSCAQQDTAVYLKTLRVTNCLLPALPADGRLITPGVTQRVENISGMPVVIELEENHFKGPIARVYGDEGRLNREIPSPRLHDPTYVPPKLLEFPLKPGEAVIFNAAFPDLLERQPRADERYTVFMATDMAFRYAGEPVGWAFTLRTGEANRYEVYTPASKFEGVVLR